MNDVDRNENDPSRGVFSDLPCATVGERLHLVIEGEADLITDRSVRNHLRRCPSCAAEAREIEEERIAFLEAVVVSPELSSHFADRVVDEIRRQEAEALGKRKLHRLRSMLAAGGLAAAIALAAAAGFLTVPSSPTSPVSPASPVSVAALGGGGSSEPVLVPSLRPQMLLVKACDRDLPATPTSLRLNLPEWIDFSADFFSLGEVKPCQRDVNQDGQTDISDAAHLFMLAVTQSPAEPANSSLDDLDLDCTALCQI